MRRYDCYSTRRRQYACAQVRRSSRFPAVACFAVLRRPCRRGGYFARLGRFPPSSITRSSLFYPCLAYEVLLLPFCQSRYMPALAAAWHNTAEKCHSRQDTSSHVLLLLRTAPPLCLLPFPLPLCSHWSAKSGVYIPSLVPVPAAFPRRSSLPLCATSSRRVSHSFSPLSHCLPRPP